MSDETNEALFAVTSVLSAIPSAWISILSLYVCIPSDAPT